MKRSLALISVAAAACVAALSLAACTAKGYAAEYVLDVNGKELLVFTAPAITGEVSVRDYFDGLVGEGKITYTIADGMIVSVNGTENVSEGSSGTYWMFYTDLVELDGVTYADTAYTYEYEGKTLASFVYGVEEMPVVEGYVYAAVYERI